jgi:predicted RecA/RadA family phage recombinase
MAKNRKFETGSNPLPLLVPAGVKSGDPVVVGQIPGVALLDSQYPAKTATDCGGVYNFSVEGKNKAGEKAIAEGDIIYIKEGKLSVNNEEGTRFGYAMGAVVKNKTEVIPVKVGY